MRNIACLATVLLLACKSEAPQPPQAAETPQKAERAAASGAREIEIYDGSGSFVIRAKKRDDGNWNLKDAAGQKIGKVKIQGDRVKAKDASDAVLAKVKKKEDGFKLYAKDDAVLFKAKYKGAGELKIKNDVEELGRLTGLSGTLQGQPVAIEKEGDKTVVKKGGQKVAEVKGDIPPEPAGLLAFDGLDPYQKAALLIFVLEVL